MKAEKVKRDNLFRLMELSRPPRSHFLSPNHKLERRSDMSALFACMWEVLYCTAGVFCHVISALSLSLNAVDSWNTSGSWTCESAWHMFVHISACAHFCYKYQSWLTLSCVWAWQLLFVAVDRLFGEWLTFWGSMSVSVRWLQGTVLEVDTSCRCPSFSISADYIRGSYRLFFFLRLWAQGSWED